jgi:hypothetical protein
MGGRTGGTADKGSADGTLYPVHDEVVARLAALAQANLPAVHATALERTTAGPPGPRNKITNWCDAGRWLPA